MSTRLNPDNQYRRKKKRKWSIKTLFLFFSLSLLWFGPQYLACSESPKTQKPVKLVLTTFKYDGFGSSGDSFLIVTELSGTYRNELCLFFRIQYADKDTLELTHFRGLKVAEDESLFITQKMTGCANQNVSCLPGSISRKSKEYVVQLNRYGNDGGQLIAELYSGSCDKLNNELLTHDTVNFGLPQTLGEKASENVSDGGATGG